VKRTALVLGALIAAGPVAAAGQDASADSAAVIALEQEMSRLLAAGRIDEYATHLTADFARTTREGKLESREEALAAWRTRGPGVAVLPADLRVRVYGDAAVLTGALVGTDASAPRQRITKTFVRQQGRWLLAALAGSGGG
jgi:hypothetical protein